ncbi:hypothetical protein ACQJBY_001057 [Aegilops geniculata]
MVGREISTAPWIWGVRLWITCSGEVERGTRKWTPSVACYISLGDNVERVPGIKNPTCFSECSLRSMLSRQHRPIHIQEICHQLPQGPASSTQDIMCPKPYNNAQSNFSSGHDSLKLLSSILKKRLTQINGHALRKIAKEYEILLE